MMSAPAPTHSRTQRKPVAGPPKPGGLLERLDDKPRRGPPLREVAMRKMEGYTNAELAEQFDCSERTVERGLQLIRRKWKEESDQ